MCVLELLFFFLAIFQRRFESPLVVSLFIFSFHYSWARSLFFPSTHTHTHIFTLVFLLVLPSEWWTSPDGGKVEEEKNKSVISSHARVNGLSFTSLPPADSYHLSEEFFLGVGLIAFLLKPLFSFCFSVYDARTLWNDDSKLSKLCQELLVLISFSFLTLSHPPGWLIHVCKHHQNIYMYSNLKKTQSRWAKTHSAQEKKNYFFFVKKRIRLSSSSVAFEKFICFPLFRKRAENICYFCFRPSRVSCLLLISAS